MKFEKRITALCAQAVATTDDAKVREILTELRLAVHQHIEDLRGGLLAAYGASIAHPSSLEETPTQPALPPSEPTAKPEPASLNTPRTWQQVVREIAHETERRKLGQLSRELSRLIKLDTERPL